MIFVASLCLLAAVAAGDETATCGISPVPEVDPVVAEHFPWVGHIEYEDLLNKTGCLASLIGPNMAVTVGYCINKFKPNYIMFPHCDKNVTPDCKFEIESALTHPNFTVSFKDYNLGILYLKNDVPVSSYFCLPDNDFNSDFMVGKDTFVVSQNFHEKGTDTFSGTPKYDLAVKRTYVMAKKDCKEAYKRVRLYDHAVCASGRGFEPCYGSAAAPLIERGDDGRWILKAILDAGPARCADSPEPSVYTKVRADLVYWIAQQYGMN